MGMKEPSWFEQVSPHLLRNRTIRTFLGQYAAKDLPEVVKLTLIYGIVNLRQSYPNTLLTVDQLRQILATGQVAVTVEQALPDVKRQLEQLRSQLEEVSDEVYHQTEARPTAGSPPLQAARPSPPLKQAHPEIAAPEQKHAPRNRRPEPRHVTLSVPPDPSALLPPPPRPPSPHFPWQQFHAPHAAPPPDDEDLSGARSRQQLGQGRSSSSDPRAPPPRRGRSSSPIRSRQARASRVPIADAAAALADWRLDPSRTWSPPGRRRSSVREEEPPLGPVYPSWWGDGSADPLPPGPAPFPVKEARKPPRLAYTLPTEQGPPIFKDDLVTAAYLKVPSSGYGQYDQRQAAPPPPYQQHPGSDGTAPEPPAWYGMLNNLLLGGEEPRDGRTGWSSEDAMQQQQQQLDGGGFSPPGGLHPILSDAALPAAKKRHLPSRDPRQAQSRIKEAVLRDRTAAACARRGASITFEVKDRPRWTSAPAVAPQRFVASSGSSPSSRAPAATNSIPRSASPYTASSGSFTPGGGGGGPGRAREGEAHSSSTSSTPAEAVAARLAANPWTAWTLSEGAGGGGGGGAPAALFESQPQIAGRGGSGTTTPFSATSQRASGGKAHLEGQNPFSPASPAMSPPLAQTYATSPASWLSGGGNSAPAAAMHTYPSQTSPAQQGGGGGGGGHVGGSEPFGEPSGRRGGGGAGGRPQYAKAVVWEVPPPSPSDWARGVGQGQGYNDQLRASLLKNQQRAASAAKADRPQPWVGDFGHLEASARFPPEKAFQHHPSKTDDHTTTPSQGGSSAEESKGSVMSELQRLREKWGAQSQQPGWQYEQYEERDRGSGSEGPSGSSAPREGSTSAWERDYHEAASSAHSLMVAAAAAAGASHLAPPPAAAAAASSAVVTSGLGDKYDSGLATLMAQPSLTTSASLTLRPAAQHATITTGNAPSPYEVGVGSDHLRGNAGPKSLLGVPQYQDPPYTDLQQRVLSLLGSSLPGGPSPTTPSVMPSLSGGGTPTPAGQLGDELSTSSQLYHAILRSGGLPHAGYPNEGETEEGNSSASDSAATEELLRRHVLRLGGEYSSGSSSG